jgi:5-methylcytosine-specific restriction enzyme A
MRARGDAKRGSSNDRGYGARHRYGFREGVFAMWGDRCVMPVEVWLDGSKPPTLCGRRATHADHYPRDRRELVAAGLDADDPQYGRPLCEYHHNQHTGRTQGRLAKGHT